MATSLIKDFLVKSGLTVQGTSDVTSSTNSTQTLQVNGGASIAKKLYVGGDTNISGNLTINGGQYVGSNFTATGAITISSTAPATVTPAAGALQVAGGARIGGNLIVMSTAATTGTTDTNALYVQGGVGIGGSLTVGGTTLFRDNVTFNGTATYVYSTNTFYTDSILELHTPPGGVNTNWTLNDGKDIGLRFHYFTNSTDTNAALILDQTAGSLEWYSSGAESPAGVFTTATYGLFKTGRINLVNTTTALSTTSGALTVAGGVGIGKDVYVGSTVSGATLVGRNLSSGKVAFVSTTTSSLLITGSMSYLPDIDLLVTTVTLAQTATNIAGGLAGDIHMQTAAGLTSFIRAGTTGQLLQSSGTTATFVNTSSLQVGFAAVSNKANVATNIENGVAGQLPYQSGISQTSFVTTGTSGYLLQSNGSAAPSWIAATATAAGTALTATNVAGGFPTAIPYQSNTGSTNFDQNFRWDSSNVVVRITNGIFTGTTNATSTITGALQVAGGVGIGGSLFVGGITTVTNVTPSSSTITGAVIVAGGVGIGGGLFVGGTVTGTNHIVTGTAISTGTATGALQVVGGVGIGGALYVGNTATVISSVIATSTNTGALQVAGGVGIGGALYVGNTATIISSVASTSTNTGALLVAGGVGIGGALYVGNTTTIISSVIATSTNTGALQVAGGVGIGGALYVGNTATIISSAVSISTNTGALQVAGGVGIGGNLNIGGGHLQAGITTITNITNATSTVTGALQIAGGVGIGGDLWVGGNIYLDGVGLDTVYGTTATFTQIYATGTNVASSTSTGALQVKGGVGVGGNIYSGGKLATVGGTVTAGAIITNAGSSGITLGGVTYSNISEGTGTTALLNFNTFNGSVISSSLIPTVTSTFTNAATVYIAAAPSSTTASVTISNAWGLYSVGGIKTDGNLTVAGSISGSVGTITGTLEQIAITNDQTSLTPKYLVAVTTSSGGNTATVVGGWGPYVIPSSGVVVINTNTVSTTATTGALRVVGGVGIGGNLNVAGGTYITGITTVTNLTSVASTNSGALQVSGGVGIAGSLFIGGSSTTTGVAYVLSSANANAANTGALQVRNGGVSVNNDVYVGGIITAGATAAATSGTVVPAFFSNNTLIASYTSPAILTTASQNLDVFATGTYRTAKYFVQVTALGGSSVHITEITLFHDNVSVYLNEFATSYSNAAGGPIGTFDATLGGGNITLTFTPLAVSTGTTVKVTRFGTTL